MDGTTEQDSAVRLTDEQAGCWQTFVSGGWALYRDFFSQLDQPAPLATADWRMLEVLQRVGRMRISDLAAATHIAISTVSRQVSRLIESGHVVRVDADGDSDARQKWVQLTDEGERTLVPILERRDRLVRELVIDRLDDGEFATLCALMGKLGNDPSAC